jgi:hypothetical protein
MGLRFTNVARGSLEELPGDYGGYLRVHDHPTWEKNPKQALYVRRLGCWKPQTLSCTGLAKDPLPR